MKGTARSGQRWLGHAGIWTVGGASYLCYRQSGPHQELRQFWQGEEERTAARLRLSSGSDTKLLTTRLSSHGVAVMPEMLPLRRDMGQEYCRPFASVLEGITFQGRPLLTASGGLNLDVFGAAIGSAISMPLLIPGSFLAGALVGESSGYLVSVMQSMQHPTLKALLDAACSRPCLLPKSRKPPPPRPPQSSCGGCSPASICQLPPDVSPAPAPKQHAGSASRPRTCGRASMRRSSARAGLRPKLQWMRLWKRRLQRSVQRGLALVGGVPRYLYCCSGHWPSKRRRETPKVHASSCREAQPCGTPGVSTTGTSSQKRE